VTHPNNARKRIPILSVRAAAMVSCDGFAAFDVFVDNVFGVAIPTVGRPSACR